MKFTEPTERASVADKEDNTRGKNKFGADNIDTGICSYDIVAGGRAPTEDGDRVKEFNRDRTM